METIRCRIKPVEWWTLPGCFFLCGLLLWASYAGGREEPELFWALWVTAGLACPALGGVAFYVTRALLYQEILADQAGLRWRGAFGGWKQARWNEISDFYLKGLTKTPTVQTPCGKIKLIAELGNREAMMARIASRAIIAPTREWEIEKYRATSGFSQRFPYWTRGQKWLAFLMPLGALYVLGFLAWAMVFNPNPTTRTPFSPSWRVDWLSFWMAVAGFGPHILLFAMILPLFYRQIRFAYRHRDEHLEVSPRGLAWQRGEVRIEASWDEVRAIDFVPGNGETAHFRVETQNGDFRVWRWLESILLWVQLINQFAPHLAVEIPLSDPDLGDEAATWSGSKIGEGARIFHFRTSDTRLVLWAATAFGVVLPLLPLLMTAMKTPDDDPAPFSWKIYAAGLFLVVLTLGYVWICFKRAAIWADDNGLEWRVPLWKTRRVAWSEIESYGHDEWGFWVQTRAKKLKLWQICAPVRKNELLQLIAKRATSATGKWESI